VHFTSIAEKENGQSKEICGKKAYGSIGRSLIVTCQSLKGGSTLAKKKVATKKTAKKGKKK